MWGWPRETASTVGTRLGSTETAQESEGPPEEPTVRVRAGGEGRGHTDTLLFLGRN